LVFYYISILPGVYATSFLTPIRALNYLSIISVFYTGFIGFSLGRRYSLPVFPKQGLVFLIIFFIFIVYWGKKDIPRMYAYKESYNKRMSFLLQESSRFKIDSDTVMVIDKLNIAKYHNFSTRTYEFFDHLYNKSKKNDFRYFPVLVDEITSDMNDFRNQALKQYHGLKFNVVVK
jgi:hypothetical protein